MTEYEIIHLPLGGESDREFVKRLFLTPEHIFPTSGETVPPGPSFSDRERQCRVDKRAEHPLADFVMEQPPHGFVDPVSRPQSISMADAEDLASDLQGVGLMENPDPHVLEIMVTPDVVVALEETDLNASFHQVHQGSENPDISLRHQIPPSMYRERVRSLGIDSRKRTNRASLSEGSATSSPRWTSATK